MRPVRAFSLVAAFALLVGVSACNTNEEQCQKLCDWEARCVQGSVSVRDCTQDCVRDADDRTDDCDEAFDDFVNCTNENQSCPGVDNRCQREAARLIQKCDCTDPQGPLKELCATDGRQ
ncbi:MAG TPA: hypothetical protein VNN72_22010 [Polyangiaceae bacterium]|nr:hypothetical protein [Polyangiaceae bacterium]